MEKYCGTGWEGMEQRESEGEKGSIKTAANLKASRDHDTLERNPLWGVEATARLQVVYGHFSCTGGLSLLETG